MKQDPLQVKRSCRHRPPGVVVDRHSSDALTLIASLDRARDKIERLPQYSSDEYAVSNLRSIAAAMDPEKNPKLKSVYERNRRGDSHG